MDDGIAKGFEVTKPSVCIYIGSSTDDDKFNGFYKVLMRNCSAAPSIVDIVGV